MSALKLADISKRYRVPEEAQPSGGLWARLSRRRRQSDFWALRDITFEVPSGQALGIIGHNGAGKSTLLKLLSNITRPTTGLMTISGRLSSLIEVGSGFHPELTGRENVYLCGAIMGMRRREIAQKFDRIVEFAGVRQFIDTPVKRYSSGMYVRLGFAIAAHLDPDILLLDEVLAVGDAVFQAKCLQRITELRDSGTTIVFISHDLDAVEKLCHRVILLTGGRITADSTPHGAIAKYREAGLHVVQTTKFSRQFLNRRIEVRRVASEDVDGTPAVNFSTGTPWAASVAYFAHEAVDNVQIDLYIKAMDGETQCLLSTRFSSAQLHVPAGSGRIIFRCDELSLHPGVYGLDVVVAQIGSLQSEDWVEQAASMQVIGGRVCTESRFFMPHQWRQESVSDNG